MTTDPFREGLARGWKVYGGRHAGAQPLPAQIRCDVAIVGTGAGAGITAELLTQAGLDVLLIEEGPLKTSSDFHQLEREAYPQLYQESAGRKTADKAINILQGRCVGGSTTVDWTSSSRTPDDTLAYWRQQFGLKDCLPGLLSPWFAQAERRLGIGPWRAPPNENNELLQRGASRLGIATATLPRNVTGCRNLGSCGLGCPTNAKQSMLVTTIPAALERGARLLVETRAQAFEHSGSKISRLDCVPVGPGGGPASQQPVRVTAKHYVVAGGAINSPALLLRSEAPDPHNRLGHRTFLHPVVVSAAVFDQKVEAWSGAPQSIYSDHFLGVDAIDGPIGYKLEAPPIHPAAFASTLAGFGLEQTRVLAQFAHLQGLLALLRDGFHPQSPGGRVRLRSDRSPVLDYPLTEFVMNGARRALLSMAEIQFAAGAREVMPVHERARSYRSWPEAQAEIAALPMKPRLTRVVSTHVMGGCGFAGDERLGVVRPDGQHWQLENLSVHDGSLFPTSLGASPQLSIYGIVNRLASGLAQRLSGRAVRLA
ncbi:GMC family oxidoreductase N-terminal domain-containing protein [Methylibium sp.]|uniref:GMC family oxidoreductase N-terminal domain-containing protein n=1 Tax=Methylibium sp. TaxID=2067992 RepID=UPI003D0DA5C9